MVQYNFIFTLNVKVTLISFDSPQENCYPLTESVDEIDAAAQVVGIYKKSSGLLQFICHSADNETPMGALGVGM